METAADSQRAGNHSTRVRSELLDPLHRVLDWMLGQREGATGALICREHGIEHTGKSAGAIVLAIELARHASGDQRSRLVEVVREQCERLVSRLEREGDSTCFTFRPGRHDPYNCSNSVIDGGACSDALATAALELGAELGEDARAAYAAASVKHAQTYLRYAIVDKGVPAQCAWAMTGAAQAYRLSGHEVLKLACRVGTERILGRQRPDGSFPYHPSDWGAGHPGASDASAYYQSRVTAFLSFALDAAYRDDPAEGRRVDAGFEAGMDFLHGLVGPDGIKVGAVEAKPWYWGGRYEVASHPFDIAAFAAEWRRTRAPRAASALRNSWRAWLRHVNHQGQVVSHLPQSTEAAADREGVPAESARSRRSYQCPFFWAAHACWIARSLPELEEALSQPDGPAPSERSWVRHFADVDLARIETSDVVAWVRGARPPGNAFHGSPAGAGLIRVFARSTGRDLFVADRYARRPEGAWSGAAGPFRLTRGLAAGGEDLRFSGWLMRNRWRTGTGAVGKLKALGEPLSALKRGVLDFSSSMLSSSFDRSSRLELDGDVVRLRGPLAHRNGGGATGLVERTYRARGAQLEVDERCVDAAGVRSLWYRVPTRAVLEQELKDHVRYTFGEGHGPR